MNHREPPHLPVGARRALQCMSLLLLPAMASEAAPALPRQSLAPVGHGSNAPGSDSVPYLAVVGSPALRFQRSTPPPPDLVSRPAAAAPPTPPLTPTESSIAQANSAAVQAAPRNLRPADEAPVTDIKPAAAPAPTPVKAAPPSILPDDTRPTVRPEDFLPYFQIPGSAKQANEVNVIMPASAVTTSSGSIPVQPSSATYTQSPK
jgi:hypothetical protein